MDFGPNLTFICPCDDDMLVMAMRSLRVVLLHELYARLRLEVYRC